MNISLQCTCGTVQGVATNITPENGNRVICCCDDCQSFARFLEREKDILDDFGGTDIFQTSQSQIKICHGNDQLRCIRLKPKGLVRWYTDCCKTPIGNTVSLSMPFVGVIHNFMRHDVQREHDLGQPRAYVQTLHAQGTPTYPQKSKKYPIGITLRIIRLMIGWRLSGKNKPSVFFDNEGRPVVKPRVLSN